MQSTKLIATAVTKTAKFLIKEFAASEADTGEKADNAVLNTLSTIHQLNFSDKSLFKMPDEFKTLTITGFLNCSNNHLHTLDNFPKEVNGDVFLHRNNFTNLKGIHNLQIRGDLYLVENPIESHLIGVLLTRSTALFTKYPSNPDTDSGDMAERLSRATSIISKYIEQRHMFIPDEAFSEIFLKCQDELINEDLDSFAEL